MSRSETWQLSKLKFWDKNPRSIKDGRFDELKARLERQGQIKPLLVTETGVVIGGNMRLKAMRELGVKEAWVSVTEAKTDKEMFDLALTDNEEFGYYEKDQLAALALDLGLSRLELQSYSISLGEPTTLDLLLHEDDEVEEDEAPEVDEVNTVSVLGEVYQLGRHRLMCGDSTKPEDATALLDGREAALWLTDPPYGISIITDKHQVGADFGIAAKGQYSAVIGDETTETAKAAYGLWSTLTPKQIIWGGNYFTDFLPFSDGWLVWDKRGDTGIQNSFADGEMAWCSFHTRVRIYTQLWNGMIREGEHDKRVHPTQKPLKTLGSIVGDFSEASDVIVDTFGGSGSALIACEQLDRTCYMMELDPKYCDVIRKRYAKLIGKEEEWEQVTQPKSQLVAPL